jgi:hypothetical protein
MRNESTAVVLVAAACLGGCSTTKIVDQPSQITLQQALQETVAALHSVQSPQAYNGSKEAIGFNPCTLQVTFSVTAGGTDNRSLVLNLAAPTGAAVAAGVQGSIGSTETASRGNTVTLLFTTPACNPTGTLGTTRPDEVSLLQQQIGEARQNRYSKPLGPVVSGGGGH